MMERLVPVPLQADSGQIEPNVGNPEESDEALMKRAQRGDRSAYATLFNRHGSRIWRMGYLLLHDAVAAEDVAQETFTRGLQHLQTFRGEAPPRAWFSSIAINVCRRFLRDGQHEPDLADREALERGHRVGRPKTRGALTTMIRKERNRRLAIALGYLTWAQREVFVLHYVDDLPYEEIAGMLEMTSGGARALAHRARTVLREKLGADPSVP